MRISRLCLLLLLGGAASSAVGQAAGLANEAVRVSPNGTRRVELPPEPPGTWAKAGKALHPDNALMWTLAMIETRDGLMECTEKWVREGACRPSTLGKKKLDRLWIVKRKGKWQACPRPDSEHKCVAQYALPHSEMQ